MYVNVEFGRKAGITIRLTRIIWCINCEPEIQVNVDNVVVLMMRFVGLD